MSTFEPEEMTQFAVTGHADDVRTFLGLVVVMSGLAHEIQGWIGSPDELTTERLVEMARAWDGFDGAEEIPVLREALMILHNRSQALPS